MVKLNNEKLYCNLQIRKVDGTKMEERFTKIGIHFYA